MISRLEEALATVPAGHPALRARLLARLSEELALAEPPTRGIESAREAMRLAREIDVTVRAN